MGKLQDMNRVKIKEKLSSEQSKLELIENCKHVVRERLSVLGLSQVNVDDETVLKYLTWGQDRIHKLSDLAGDDFLFLWHWPDRHSLKVNINKSQLREVLSLVKSHQQGEGEGKVLLKQIKTFSKSQGLKFPEVMKDLRLIITGRPDGPPITELIDILGSGQVVDRLSYFIEC